MAPFVDLPTLKQIIDGDSSPESAPGRALAILFEPSPILFSDLLPVLVPKLRQHTSGPLTYNRVVYIAIDLLLLWPQAHQAVFVGGHPRIGEVSGLSALSASEQAARATAPEVLARLSVLNAAFEARYPGLRYITFVNGKSRKDVMEEMEEKLEVGKGDVNLQSIAPLEVDDIEWKTEARRAIGDIGKIAKSRLTTLGVDGDAPL